MTKAHNKQDQGEPVAYLVYDKGACSQYLAFDDELGDMDGCTIELLYTTPQQLTWVGLTDEEIDAEADKEEQAHGFIQGVAWAEAKLKEKNTRNGGCL